MPCLRQIGERGAHADAVGVIHRNRAHARGLRVVHVWVVGMALGAETSVKSVLGRQPILFGVSPYWDGSIAAVEVVVNVSIGLQFPQEWEHIGEAPFVISHGGPGVIVLGYSSEQHLAIDGAGTADHPASGDWNGIGLLGSGVALERPVMGCAHC